MQARTMDITHQLVTDRHAALLTTAHRGRVRRLFSHTNAAPVSSLDLNAAETAAGPAPTLAIAFRTRSAQTPDTGRIHKVA